MVGLPPKVLSHLSGVDEQTEVANNGYRDGFSGLNNTEESFRNDGPSISGNFPRIGLRTLRSTDDDGNSGSTQDECCPSLLRMDADSVSPSNRRGDIEATTTLNNPPSAKSI